MDLSGGDRFGVNLTVKDWVYIGTFVVNFIALGFTGWSVYRQAKAADLNAYFQFTERFSAAWRRFKDAGDEAERDREFELTEIYGLFEAACHLYNKRRLYGVTREMVKSFLCEMLPGVFKNQYAKDVFQKSISSPTTYSEIRRFARSNKIEGVPVVNFRWTRTPQTEVPDHGRRNLPAP